jgi:hypothetical protein
MSNHESKEKSTTPNILAKKKCIQFSHSRKILFFRRGNFMVYVQYNAFPVNFAVVRI